MCAFANIRDTNSVCLLLSLVWRTDSRVPYIDNRCLRDSYRVDLCKTRLASTCLQPWFGVPCLSRYCDSCRLRWPPLRGLGSVVSRLPWSHQGFFFVRQYVVQDLPLSLHPTSYGWKANIDVFVGAPIAAFLSRQRLALCTGCFIGRSDAMTARRLRISWICALCKSVADSSADR